MGEEQAVDDEGCGAGGRRVRDGPGTGVEGAAGRAEGALRLGVEDDHGAGDRAGLHLPVGRHHRRAGARRHRHARRRRL